MSAQQLDPFKVACAAFGIAKLMTRPGVTLDNLDELAQVVGMDAVRFAHRVHCELTSKAGADAAQARPPLVDGGPA
ncbi:MAG: hypothetical protein RIQ60_1913 [Pseudomonadota bacterium]|jgi:hypothetical protein